MGKSQITFFSNKNASVKTGARLVQMAKNKMTENKVDQKH